MGATAPRGARPPSHVAYYVALAGVAGLLLLLCCYFCYFFINKIHDLSEMESLTAVPRSSQPPVPTPTYPVHPVTWAKMFPLQLGRDYEFYAGGAAVVRDSATAMAKLCKQIPQTSGSKGDTVFPVSSSPEARQHAHNHDVSVDDLPSATLERVQDKVTTSAAAHGDHLPSITLTAATR